MLLSHAYLPISSRNMKWVQNSVQDCASCACHLEENFQHSILLPEASSSLLVHLGSGGYTVHRHEKHLLRLDHTEQNLRKANIKKVVQFPGAKIITLRNLNLSWPSRTYDVLAYDLESKPYLITAIFHFYVIHIIYKYIVVHVATTYLKKDNWNKKHERICTPVYRTKTVVSIFKMDGMGDSIKEQEIPLCNGIYPGKSSPRWSWSGDCCLLGESRHGWCHSCPGIGCQILESGSETTGSSVMFTRTQTLYSWSELEIISYSRMLKAYP